MDHYLAILWKVKRQLIEHPEQGRCWVCPSEDQFYISTLSLGEIERQNNVFDLDKYKTETSFNTP